MYALSLDVLSLSWFDLGCSYLAQWLSVVCRLQHKFEITGITLESKVKVKYILNLPNSS